MSGCARAEGERRKLLAGAAATVLTASIALLTPVALAIAGLGPISGAAMPAADYIRTGETTGEPIGRTGCIISCSYDETWNL